MARQRGALLVTAAAALVVLLMAGIRIVDIARRSHLQLVVRTSELARQTDELRQELTRVDVRVQQQTEFIGKQMKQIDHLNHAIKDVRANTGFDGNECSINPSFHYEETGEVLPECRVQLPVGVLDDMDQVLLPDKYYMLNMAGNWERYGRRRDYFLQQLGLKLERVVGINGNTKFAYLYKRADVEGTAKLVYVDPKTRKTIRPGEAGYLSPGERGYLTTMATVFEKVKEDPSIKTFAVFDDDAILHCDFLAKLKQLLAQRRCGLPVEPFGAGGVLLLGSAIWINGTWPERGKYTGGWKLVQHDMQQAQAVTGLRSLCHNVDSKTLGSFGAVYHRNVAEAALEWIETATSPFDHIWKHLTSKGFAVRAAYPSIVIQDVRHASAVDADRTKQEDMRHRAAIHRWPLFEFCDTTNPHQLVPFS